MTDIFFCNTVQAKTLNVSFDESFDEYIDSIENNISETVDDSEIVDEEPLMDWELDTPIPSWIQKAMERHKTLTTQTDPYEKFESSKEQ